MPSHYLSPEICESLAAIPGAKSTRWAPRAVLFSSGEGTTGVYLVRAGVVGLDSVQNGTTLLVHILGPGAILGCEIVFEDAAHAFSATAFAPVQALQIPAEGFLNWCEATPVHWKAIMRYMIGQSSGLARKVEQLCAFDVRDRILHYLDELAEIGGVILPEGRVLCLSQLEVARYVGATRETTSTVLNALAREGLISLGHRRITVRRASAMAAGSGE